MQFKDYYATLGVAKTATQDEIKRAYRKLARKYHPDVSKEAHAEDRFKEVAEAHEALIDPERRAAYDDIGKRHAQGQPFEPPTGWDSGFEFSGRDGPDRGRAQRRQRGDNEGFDGADFSDFFESIFGRSRDSAPQQGAGRQTANNDHHAKVSIDLQDSFLGALRTITLRMPLFDAAGQGRLQERQLEVQIPKGVRPGQHLRLAGQGAVDHEGHASQKAGDLYLEIAFNPHPKYRLDGRDIYMDLPLAPWEAALGAEVTAATPQGEVTLTVPAGSQAGRKLRLKGRGLPAANADNAAGDLYAVLGLALPAADSEPAKAAYAALASAFAHYDARSDARSDARATQKA
jgi:curved DNA-binding protein